MTFTEEEMQIITNYLPLIEKIIVNNSCSNLTIAFRQDMTKLATKLKLNYCITCSSGIFNLVSRIYKLYNEQLISNGKGKKNRIHSGKHKK